MGILGGLARAFTGKLPRIEPDDHVLIEDGFAPGLMVSTPTYRVYAVKMDAEGNEIPPRRYLERQPLEDASMRRPIGRGSSTAARRRSRGFP